MHTSWLQASAAANSCKNPEVHSRSSNIYDSSHTKNALDSAAYSTVAAVTKIAPLQGMWLLPVNRF